MTDTYYCAFCQKSQHEVATLIAGPAHRGEGLFVCDKCADMLAGIVAEKRGAATSGPRHQRESHG